MFKKLLILFLGVFVLSFSAEASHFRYAHNTWRLISTAPNGDITVEFHSLQAWRASGPDMLPIVPGDGSSAIIGAVNDIGTFMDLSGDGYIVREYTVQHTYTAQSVTNFNGIFLAYSESCCRISNLINAADDSERIETVVDLNNGNTGSPVSSSPIILQMGKDQLNVINLGIADPDHDPFTCRMATQAESLISSLATIGTNVVSVSNNCRLSWDTTGGTTGDKYAVQIIIEENAPGSNCNPQASASGLGCGSVALDFIIEIVEGNAPTCTSLVPSNNVAFVGQPFSATFTGNDIDPEDVLTVLNLGLPSGASLNPVSGSMSAPPFPASFAWTPQESDRGTAKAVTVIFRDLRGLEGSCTIGIEVPDDDPPTCAISGQASNLLCQGGSSQFPFEGGESSDPQGLPLGFSWDLAGCGSNARISGQGEAISVVVEGRTGMSCDLSLAVSNGKRITTCHTPISVLPCETDCNGVPGGSAIFDQCGVCGGDGTSCTQCTESIINRDALDGSAFAQKRAVDVLAHRIRRLAKMVGGSAGKRALRTIKNAKLDANDMYNENWHRAYTFAEKVNVSCANVQFCTASDLSATKAGYESEAQNLKSLGLKLVTQYRSLLTKLGAKKVRARTKRARGTVEDAFEDAKGFIQQVPVSSLNC